MKTKHRMKTFWQGIKEIFSDNRGHLSSLRIMVFLTYLLLIWIFLEWRYAFRLEVIRDRPNYEGITTLFVAMMVTFWLTLFAKVLQKKQEKED